MLGVSLTHPVLPLFLCGEFLLHIPSCLDFYVRSFSYTSGAGFFSSSFFSIWGLSLTHPVLVYFYYWGVSLTHPGLPSFLCGKFFLHIPCWLHFYFGSFSYTSGAGFSFSWGVSLTHPTLTSFLSGVFLLRKLCWLHFHLGSFSYTSHAGFIFLWGVYPTYPMLASFVF